MKTFEITEPKKDYTRLIAIIIVLVLCILMSIELVTGKPLLWYAPSRIRTCDFAVN